MRFVLKTALVLTLVASGSIALGQRVGKPAPEINSPNFFGQDSHVSLAKYRGKLVLLVFWRTTDAASLELIPTLNDLHRKYRQRGVVIIALTDEDKEKVESVVNGKQIQYIVGYGGNVDGAYNVSAFPQAFLIDTKGLIAWRGHPGDGLEERVKNQMQKTPPAGADEAATRKRYERAQEAFEDGEHGRAYTLANEVADAADGNIAEKAKALREQALQGARNKLDAAKQAAGGDKPEEAVKTIADISVRFAGSDLGRSADEELAKLRSEAKTSGLVKPALDGARATLRFEQGADLEKDKQFLDALEVFREVSEKFAATEAAKNAQKAIERISTDKSIQAQIAAARSEAQADRWLDLGDRFAKVEMYDLARENYDRVIQTHPRSAAAAKAKERMAKLPKQP